MYKEQLENRCIRRNNLIEWKKDKETIFEILTHLFSKLALNENILTILK